MTGPYLFDRVRDTTTTTGTDTLTLANSPPSAHQAFSAWGNGNTGFYGLAHRTANEWEVGIGTYSSTGPTLARTTILASSNSGSAVSLSSGTKDVFGVAPADIMNRFSCVTNTVANLAAYQAGRLLMPSNGVYLYRDTGSALAPWGPLYAMTAPVSGDFSWLNQGSASVSTTNGGVYFTAPTITPGSATFAIRARTKSKTGTYKITMGFLPFLSGPYCRMGFMWRQSSNGKIVTTGLECRFPDTDRGLIFASYKWDSTTTYNSQYIQGYQGGYTTSPFWTQVEVDSTNRIVRHSPDGLNWIDVHTISKTDFITADEVGYFIDNQYAYYASAMNLIHWKEE